jgi:hypothetical protein
VSISVEQSTVHIRHVRTHHLIEHDISFVARLTGADVQLPFLSISIEPGLSSPTIHPYTNECLDFDNVYAIGALAGDRLVRFLTGGAFACAANLLKKSKLTT